MDHFMGKNNSLLLFLYNSTHYDRNPTKKRRLNLLHPKMTDNKYDHELIQLPLSSNLIDYDALTSDFIKTCQMGNNVVSICYYHI